MKISYYRKNADNVANNVAISQKLSFFYTNSRFNRLIIITKKIRSIAANVTKSRNRCVFKQIVAIINPNMTYTGSQLAS